MYQRYQRKIHKGRIIPPMDSDGAVVEAWNCVTLTVKVVYSDGFDDRQRCHLLITVRPVFGHDLEWHKHVAD